LLDPVYPYTCPIGAVVGGARRAELVLGNVLDGLVVPVAARITPGSIRLRPRPSARGGEWVTRPRGQTIPTCEDGPTRSQSPT
jgi:hypothetical protein